MRLDSSVFGRTTDVNGRHEYTRTSGGALTMDLDPPPGYEHRQGTTSSYFGYQIPGPGTFTVTLRWIRELRIFSAPTTIPLDGQLYTYESYGLTCPALLDTGEIVDAVTYRSVIGKKEGGVSVGEPRIIRQEGASGTPGAGMRAMQPGRTYVSCVLWGRESQRIRIEVTP